MGVDKKRKYLSVLTRDSSSSTLQKWQHRGPSDSGSDGLKDLKCSACEFKYFVRRKTRIKTSFTGSIKRVLNPLSYYNLPTDKGFYLMECGNCGHIEMFTAKNKDNGENVIRAEITYEDEETMSRRLREADEQEAATAERGSGSATGRAATAARGREARQEEAAREAETPPQEEAAAARQAEQRQAEQRQAEQEPASARQAEAGSVPEGIVAQRREQLLAARRRA